VRVPQGVQAKQGSQNLPEQALTALLLAQLDWDKDGILNSDESSRASTKMYAHSPIIKRHVEILQEKVHSEMSGAPSSSCSDEEPDLPFVAHGDVVHYAGLCIRDTYDTMPVNGVNVPQGLCYTVPTYQTGYGCAMLKRDAKLSQESCPGDCNNKANGGAWEYTCGSAGYIGFQKSKVEKTFPVNGPDNVTLQFDVERTQGSVGRVILPFQVLSNGPAGSTQAKQPTDYEWQLSATLESADGQLALVMEDGVVRTTIDVTIHLNARAEEFGLALTIAFQEQDFMGGAKLDAGSGNMDVFIIKSANCVLGAVSATNCLADCVALTETITTARKGTGTCTPGTHICVAGEGACSTTSNGAASLLPSFLLAAAGLLAW